MAEQWRDVPDEGPGSSGAVPARTHAAGQVETVYEDGQWWLKVGGLTPRVGPYREVDEAVQDGRDLARELRRSLVVRTTEGQISETWTW